MFTGIIEDVGTVTAVQKSGNSARLTIQAAAILDDVQLGDSIAVNGVCLTVTAMNAATFSADVMHETLARSSLGQLHGGSQVNLERAMAANGRFGGHMVSGHIDGTGVISGIRRDENAVWYTVRTDAAILRYIIEKGSVAMDGISLTVARVSDEDFSVSVIPHTAANTTLSARRCGDVVNLENDCIGKYVEKLLRQRAAPAPSGSKSNVTMALLAQAGYLEGSL